MFADAWLSGWLAEISADLRENGSALEVVLHDYALYKIHVYFTLLTLLYTMKPDIGSELQFLPTTPAFNAPVRRAMMFSMEKQE